MKQYYYADSQSQQAGPVTYEQLAELHKRGAITSATMVFEEGTTEWKPYSAHNFPGAAMPGYDSVGASIPPKKSGCGWGWYVALGCFLIMCLFGGIALVSCGGAIFALSSLASSIKADTKEILSEVESNADVQRELGTGLEAEFPSTYNYNTDNGVTTFVATFEVKGSKGKGTMSVDRVKSGTGAWRNKKLSLEVNGNTYNLSGGGGDGSSSTDDSTTDEKGKMKLKR